MHRDREPNPRHDTVLSKGVKMHFSLFFYIIICAGKRSTPTDRRSPFCGRIVTLDHWPTRSLEGLLRSLLVQYCNPEGAKLHFYFQVFQHGNVRFTIYILISTWKCHFFHFHTHFNIGMDIKFLVSSFFNIFSKFIHRNALKT